MDDVIPQSAVAQLLECDENTVQERARTGDLPGVKFGRSWVFPRQALVARLNEIAIEQASKRRGKPEPKPIAAAVGAKTPRRAPPTLPELCS